MGTLWRIAWRNLGRNRRRTAVTAAAIAVGVALCVATYGLTDGLNEQLVKTVTRLEIGHVQVHHPEYPKRRSMRYTIDRPAPLLAAADRIELARGAAPRAFAWALASKGASSTGVEIVGVDPPRERTVTELFDRKIEGAVLPDEPTAWPEGREMTAEERAWDRKVTERETEEALAELDALPSIGDDDGGDDGGGGDGGEDSGGSEVPGGPETDGPVEGRGDRATGDAEPTTGGDRGGAAGLRERTVELVRDLSPPPEEPPPVMLGERLAKSLDAGVGDLVYLLTSTTDGRTAEERFRVVGLYRTGSAMMDRTRAYVHLADLQRFVHLGERVHEIAAVADDPDEASALAGALASVDGAGDLLVRPWYEVKPMLKRMLDLNDASVGLMLGIIFIVAALGVLNTMLMAVFERTRELGVLMALGLRPWQIRKLVMVETVFLTLIGGALGTLGGLGLDLYLLLEGWDLRSMTGGFSVAGVTVDPVLRASIEARGVLVPLLAISIVVFVASFWPANRAAKLSPTRAMRTA